MYDLSGYCSIPWRPVFLIDVILAGKGGMYGTGRLMVKERGRGKRERERERERVRDRGEVRERVREKQRERAKCWEGKKERMNN